MSRKKGEFQSRGGGLDDITVLGNIQVWGQRRKPWDNGNESGPQKAPAKTLLVRKTGDILTERHGRTWKDCKRLGGEDVGPLEPEMSKDCKKKDGKRGK